MRKLLSALALLSLVSASGCVVAPVGAEEAIASSARMNVLIDQTNFVVNQGCSGTLIDLAKRYVLTASHCVGDQYETKEREKIDDKGVVTKEKVRVLKPGTVTQLTFQSTMEAQRVVYRTKLVKVDKDMDLALLQILEEKIPNTMASKVSCTEPKRLDPVMIVGNPMGDLYSSANRGVVSSVQRTYGLINFDNDNPDEELMQVTAGIVGGNSGGSVYNDKGELIGVPVLGHRTLEVIGFAVPLSVIHKFLDGQLDLGCEK
jgi:S1-C subfamily serine protease